MDMDIGKHVLKDAHINKRRAANIAHYYVQSGHQCRTQLVMDFVQMALK